MKTYDLIDYVQNVHIESQREIGALMRRVVEKHDFDALNFDNTSKVIIKLWDALNIIAQKLQED